MTDQPTRGEFDLLKQMVVTGQTRLDNIDDHGTRGVTGLQAQMTEVVKDLAELKADVNARFEAHTRQHDQDRRERVTGRRWLIGTGIAGLMAMSAVAGLLVEVLMHVHG